MFDENKIKEAFRGVSLEKIKQFMFDILLTKEVPLYAGCWADLTANTSWVKVSYEKALEYCKVLAKIYQEKADREQRVEDTVEKLLNTPLSLN